MQLGCMVNTSLARSIKKNSWGWFLIAPQLSTHGFHSYTQEVCSLAVNVITICLIRARIKRKNTENLKLLWPWFGVSSSSLMSQMRKRLWKSTNKTSTFNRLPYKRPSLSLIKFLLGSGTLTGFCFSPFKISNSSLPRKFAKYLRVLNANYLDINM